LINTDYVLLDSYRTKCLKDQGEIEALKAEIKKLKHEQALAKPPSLCDTEEPRPRKETEKTMKILQTSPPTSFKQCQLCGFTSPHDDICSFQMWQRSDAQDNPVEDYLITCKGDACSQRIQDDPMLFREVAWSQGGPGKFMLLCGDCHHRDGFRCTHRNLKTSGGVGLLVNFAQTPLSGTHICFTNGTSHTIGNPATRCEGHPDPQKLPSKDVG